MACSSEAADELRSIGLQPASDAIGNVIAAYDGYGANPVVVGAHLDTIFPADVPLQLRRSGTSAGNIVSR